VAKAPPCQATNKHNSSSSSSSSKLAAAHLKSGYVGCQRVTNASVDSQHVQQETTAAAAASWLHLT
jgi:hypothetical protein